MDNFCNTLQPVKLADVINRPAHYTFGKYEVIDVIEDWQLGFHLGAAVKYIARAGRKDPTKKLEDLEKAVWYLKRYIEKAGKLGSGSEPLK